MKKPRNPQAPLNPIQEEKDKDQWPEKRKFERYHTRIKIPFWKYIQFEREGEFNSGFVKDISAGGFFIETDFSFEPSSKISFVFYLPDSPKEVSGVGIVRWVCRPEDSDKDISVPVGMGVEFSHFNGNSETNLNEYIQKILDQIKK